MAKVEIGITDEKLLDWFNEIHAALQETEEKYKKAVLTNKIDERFHTDRRLLTSKSVVGGEISTSSALKEIKEADSRLIAVLQSVIKKIRAR